MPGSFPFSTGLRVVGEEGAVELNWYWGANGPINDLVRYPLNGEPERLSIPDYDPYEAECRYCIDALLGRNDGSILSIENAWESLRVAAFITGFISEWQNAN